MKRVGCLLLLTASLAVGALKPAASPPPIPRAGVIREQGPPRVVPGELDHSIERVPSPGCGRGTG